MPNHERKAVEKKVKTETGWTYRGIEIVKTPSGRYQTTNGELNGKYGERTLTILMSAIDDKFAAVATLDIEYQGYVGTGNGTEVALAVGKHPADVQRAAEAECEARGIENWDWWINEVQVHRRDRTGRAVAGVVRTRLSSVAGLEEVGTEFSLDDD